MSDTRSLRIGIAQNAARYNDVVGMLAWLEGVLERQSADLILLPEAAFTGYVSPWGDFDLSGLAEPLDGFTATACATLARRYRTVLAVPLIERDGERCFNSLLLFNRVGERVGHWRKLHPWMPETWATPGDLGTPVVELEGVRFTAGICFDLHFLAEESASALREADVLLFPSAWVEDEDSRPWRLAALAREFGLVVVNANWGAGRPCLPGQGGSVIVAPDGVVAAQTGVGSGEGWCMLDLPFD